MEAIVPSVPLLSRVLHHKATLRRQFLDPHTDWLALLAFLLASGLHAFLHASRACAPRCELSGRKVNSSRGQRV